MSTITENQQKAEASRSRAAEHVRSEQDSFERSDTDGFITQWAHGCLAGKERLQAQIDEQGGLWEFPALFDLEGNMVAATRHDGQYGMVWRLLGDDNPGSPAIGWVNESKARKEETAIANMVKKGYYKGYVKAPAVADLGGSGRGMAGALTVHAYVRRVGASFDRDAEVVDNGQAKLKEMGLI